MKYHHVKEYHTSIYTDYLKKLTTNFDCPNSDNNRTLVIVTDSYKNI